MQQFLPMRLLAGIAGVTLVAAAAPAAALDHTPFDRLLRAHVRAGRVDYAAIHARDRARLNAYVQALATARPGRSRAERLAFYLNAYNALVIKAVVERWPNVSDVTKIKGFFDGARYRVAGRKVTLDQLEKRIIRPQFKDPRTHFALVCAARSCPPLRSRAFTAARLERVLERLTRRFINSPRGVQIKGKTIRVSKIFKWYAGEFKQAAGSVGAYVARYHRQHADTLRKATKLSYLPYDWSLNKLNKK